MCFAGERRSDRTSTIRIVFYLFGSIAGFRLSLRWLRSSGRRPSFAGTVLGFAPSGAGDPATEMTSAAYSWRVAQARLRGRPVDGRSVHVPPLAATVSGLADVSQQSRRRHRGDRPLCPADDHIRNSVLSCHCAPRTTTLGVVWRDGKPNRGVDLAPSHRGVPVGPRAAISHSGSRHLVWFSLFAADPCHGHSGPSDRTPIALAKCLRREAHRIDPPRMSRPHDRVWRSAPAPDPTRICRLL